MLIGYIPRKAGVVCLSSHVLYTQKFLCVMRLILALLFCVLLTVLAKRERKKEKERNRGLKTGFYSIYFFF